MKYVVFVILAFACFFCASPAHATTTCSVTSITALTFGTVDPTTGTVDTTATLNYSCTYDGGLLGILFGDFVTACFSLAPNATGAYNPRGMTNATGETMQYSIYTDPARTTVWGSTNSASFPAVQVRRLIPILTVPSTVTGSVTLYGRVSSPQPSLSTGAYSDLLMSGLAGNAVAWQANEVLLNLGGYPASCTSGGFSGGGMAAAPGLPVSAVVLPKCTLGVATDLNFGTVPGLLLSNTDQTSLVRVTCTNRAPWQIGLDNGQNAQGATRRMRSGSSYVAYELYTQAARTQRWGNEPNVDTRPGTGAGSEQTLTVYGRVPAQTAVPPGVYSDTTIVTVTY